MNRGIWIEFRMELVDAGRSGAEFVFVGEGVKPTLELTMEQWRALAPEGITPPVSLNLRLEGLWPSATELRKAGVPVPTELGETWREGYNAALEWSSQPMSDAGDEPANPYGADL